MTSFRHMRCHSWQLSQRQFLYKTMLGHTQQGYHKTASTTLPPFPGLLDPRFVTNPAYMGSFGMTSWTFNEFERIRGAVTLTVEQISQYNIWNLYALMPTRIIPCNRAKRVQTEF
ncbi:hypothetical protein TNCV_3680351 [Trichonephila clavipes]|nr:hypothetical protein TNCV_3680351 [Trichonephila clavipes]